jgi:hypothetical protein
VGGGRERFGRDESAQLVDHRGHVDVFVGVDPADHPQFGLLRDGGHVTPAFGPVE